MPISPQADDIGRAVVYREYPGAKPEQGVITFFNDAWVFVRYGADAHAKATNSANLEWVSARDR